MSCKSIKFLTDEELSNLQDDIGCEITFSDENNPNVIAKKVFDKFFLDSNLSDPEEVLAIKNIIRAIDPGRSPEDAYRDALRQYVEENIPTKTESENRENIDEDKTSNDNLDYEEPELLLSLNERLRDLFKDRINFKTRIVEQIKQELSDKLIVDYDTRTILINNPKELNRAIRDYKIELLTDLANYLKDSGITVPIKPDSLLNSVGNISADGLKWYNEIISLANKHYNDAKMNKLYLDAYDNSPKAKKRIRALKAFILLSSDGKSMGFDNFVHEKFPKLLSINKGVLFAGLKDNVYSVSLDRGTKKPFGTDRMDDGESQMGVLGKMLIEGTPKIDLNGKQDGYVTYDDVMMAFHKIKLVTNLENVRSLEDAKEILEPILNLLRKPVSSMLKILKILTRSTKNYQSAFHLTDSDRIILNSIYLRFFNGDYSLMKIEHRNRIYGSKANTLFSIVSTLVGAILRNEKTDYVQVEFDSKLGMTVVKDLNTGNIQRTRIQFDAASSQALKTSKTIKRNINKYNLSFYREKSKYSDGSPIPKESPNSLGKASGGIFLTLKLNEKESVLLLINPKRLSDGITTTNISNDERILIVEYIDGNPTFTNLKIFTEGLKTEIVKDEETGKFVEKDIDNEELSLQFPSIKEIREYFTTKRNTLSKVTKIGNLDLTDPNNKGYLITLKLLEAVTDLLPGVDLAGEELPILLLWLLMYGYTGNKDTATIRVIQLGISELLNISARNILLVNKINDIRKDNPEFEITKFLNSTIGFVNGKVSDYYNEGSDSIKFIWGQASLPINLLAEAYNDILGRHFRYVTDKQGNKLPMTRLFTMINHLYHYGLDILRDTKRKVKSTRGYKNENIGVLSDDLFFTEHGTNSLLLEPPRVYVDATNQFGKTKKVSEMSAAELNYDALFNRFLLPLINPDATDVYIHHITYADKTTIPNFKIPKNKLKFTINGTLLYIDFGTIPIAQLKTIIQNTVGKQYRRIGKNIVNSYRNIIRNLAETNPDIFKRWVEDAKNISVTAITNSDIKSKLMEFVSAIQNANITDVNTWNYEAFAGLMLAATDERISVLNKCANNINEKFIKEIHYSKSYIPGFKYGINYQIYHYSQYLFAEGTNNIDTLFRSQIIEYVKDLSTDFKLLPSEDNSLKLIFESFDANGIKLQEGKKSLDTVTLADEWIDENTGYIILAKDTNGNPVFDKNRLNRSCTINPIIERYFYSNYLLIQNLKGISSGSEIGHGTGKLKKYALTATSWNDLMVMEESARTNSSFKRTVDLGVPGVLLLQDDILGVPPKVRIAVMEDLQATAFNILGKTEELDGNDGSAITNPIFTLLVLLSLQDCAGKDIIKSIVRDLHGEYGTNILIKYASFAMMNKTIRDSLNYEGPNSANLLRLFLLMTDLKFDEEYGDGLDAVPEYTRVLEKDEKGKPIRTEQRKVTDVPVYDEEGNLIRYDTWKIDLTKNLQLETINVSDMSDGNPIYYYENGRHYQLRSIKKAEGDHRYTIEKVQVFNSNGKVKAIDDTVTTETVTINSLWELYKILGGCFSENFINGEFVYGDTSLYTLVNYVNNIGRTYITEGERAGEATIENYLTLSNTYLPLKGKFIASLVNNSAIKNGAANINPKSMWNIKDPTKLNTMTLRTSGYLMVLDYDHLVTDGESTLTEFTLVISALVEKGTSFKLAKTIYETLAKISAAETLKLLRALENFAKVSGKKEELYKIIGKILIKNFKHKDGAVSLYQEHILALLDLFNKAKGEFNIDDMVLPFSEASAFVLAVTTIISNINAVAIKRKFPGSGLIMVPSFGWTKSFNIPGSGIRSFSDMLAWINNVDNQGNVYSLDLGYVFDKDGKRYPRKLEVTLDNESSTITLVLDGNNPLITEDLKYPDINVLSKLYKIVKNIYDLNGVVNISEKLPALVKDILTLITLYVQTEPEAKPEFGENLFEDPNRQVVLNFKNFIKHATIKSYVAGKKDVVKTPSELLLGLVVFIIKKDDTGTPRIYNPTLETYILDLNHPANIESVYIDSPSTLYKYSNPDKYEGFIVDYSTPRDLLPTTISFKDSNRQEFVIKNVTSAKSRKIFQNSSYELVYNTDGKLEGLKVINDKTKKVGIITGIINQQYDKDGLLIITITENNGNVITIEGETKTIKGTRKNLWLLPVIKKNIEILQSEDSSELEKKLAERAIQLELNNVYNGLFTGEDGKLHPYQKNTLRITDYEAKIPRIFATQFKLRAGDSIADIIEKDYKFFLERFREANQPAIERGWDLCFTNSTRKHTYVTFTKPDESKIIPVNYVYVHNDGEFQWVLDANGNNLYPRSRVKRDKDGKVITKEVILKDGTTKQEPVWEDCVMQILSPGNTNETIYYAVDAKAASKIYSKDNESLIINLSTKIDKNTLLDFFTELEEKSHLRIPKNHRLIMELLKDDEITKTSIITTINDAFLMDESKARSICNSFKESLKLIVARIPALTQQSFMKMRVVGFLDTDSNQIQVSHFQTWILGSDYDIDKAYAMALSIKDSGLLYTWSPFFIMSNVEEFEKSRTIPIPSGKTVTQSKKGVDISFLADRLLSKYNGNELLLFYGDGHNDIVEILKSVDDNELVFINDEVRKKYIISEKQGKKTIKRDLVEEILMKAINRHTTYFSNLDDSVKYDRSKPSRYEILQIFKNVVAYGIMDVVTDPRNLINAQSPVSFGVLGPASEKSPLGLRNRRLISSCPSMVNITTEDNLSGKMGIGVGANGAKDNFALIYHYMDSISSEDIHRLRRLPFSFTITFPGKPKERITVLPSINNSVLTPDQNDNVKNAIRKYLRSRNVPEEEINKLIMKYDEGSENTALTISAIISAATDNAKELILRKINADPKYMKIYLFSAILNIDLRDVAELMISDDVDFILNQCRENMFDPTKQTYVNSTIERFLTGPYMPTLSEDSWKEILDRLGKKYPEFKNLTKERFIRYLSIIYKEKVKRSYTNEDGLLILTTLEFFNAFTETPLTNTYNWLALNRFKIKFLEYLQHYDPETSPQRMEAFKTLLKGGDEISMLARFLKINLGVPPVPHDFIEYLVKLEADITKLFLNATSKLSKSSYVQNNELLTNFDLKRFFIDEQYRLTTITLADETKTCFNVLDVIWHSPHIRLAFVDIFTGVRSINAVSSRFELMRKIRKDLLNAEKDPKTSKATVNKSLWNLINRVIDSLMIYGYLVQLDISFPIESGTMTVKRLNDTLKRKIQEKDELINISSSESISKFKYWFENTFLELLKNPALLTDLDQDDKMKLADSVLLHDLANGTTRDSYSGMDIIISKFGFINFFEVAKSGYSLDKYNLYLKEIPKIGKIKIFGRPLIDWFFIYDLITSKDKLTRDNLNPILIPFVNDESTLIPDYFRQMDAKDKSREPLIPVYTVEPFLKAAAPVVTRYNYDSYEYKDFMYVRIYNSDTGGFDLYVRSGSAGSEELPDEPTYDRFPGLSFVKSLGSHLDSNYSGLQGISDMETSLLKHKITKNMDLELIKEKVKNLMMSRILSINVNCS